MNVNNTLVQKKKNLPDDYTVEFKVGNSSIKLSPNIVKSYLVSGDPDKVTDAEVAMFINLCKYQGLNPWLKEAYCIKYGTRPATIVVGKDAFMKRAENDPNFDGFEAGVIVADQNGDVDERPGTFVLKDEQVLGGWAKVYRKDRSHPVQAEISFNEYAGRKSDGTVNSQWSGKPATMCRKVALVQALREAFPTSLGGMYTSDEMDVSNEDALPDDISGKVEAAAVQMDEETGEVKSLQNSSTTVVSPAVSVQAVRPKSLLD